MYRATILTPALATLLMAAHAKDKPQLSANTLCFPDSPLAAMDAVAGFHDGAVSRRQHCADGVVGSLSMGLG
jgi:hypothetical protein